MRINNVFSGRPMYYDRNPTQTVQNYNANVGPVGDTTRWTYTVPTGRKAFVEATSVFIRRVGAAAPVGDVLASIRFYPNGGGYFPINEVGNQNNVVGQVDRQAGSFQAMMSASDQLQAHTGDVGTGGTVFFDITGKVVEFDA